MELWTEFGKKLTSTKSVPEAVQAYQQTMSQRMQMAAEDSQKVAADSQKVTQKIMRTDGKLQQRVEVVSERSGTLVTRTQNVIQKVAAPPGQRPGGSSRRRRRAILGTKATALDSVEGALAYRVRVRLRTCTPLGTKVVCRQRGYKSPPLRAECPLLET